MILCLGLFSNFTIKEHVRQTETPLNFEDSCVQLNDMKLKRRVSFPAKMELGQKKLPYKQFGVKITLVSGLKMQKHDKH